MEVYITYSSAQSSHLMLHQLTFLQNTTTRSCSDSPARTRSTSSTQHVSPSSSDSSATIKPLPAIPHMPPPYADDEPYRDDPPTPSEGTPSTRLQTTAPTHHPQSQHSLLYRPYTDSTPPHTPIADDVPLAHLISTHTYAQSTEFSSQPNDAFYPADAPPPYAIAVRQSYRDTLVQYIPSSGHDSRVAEDEESQLGMDVARPDDVRYSIEKIVAMFVVALLLLVVSGILGWLALGNM
ncbi:hypothetical protein G6011_05140 [Alternaria panax]|uniref:Uncharacterized protein n=1 Tax=Alternaria panax TaxID=48097 RepID=A0AAD4FBC2_9PLEO|nr:hypothetical protein G6011_05140 [Alternaria panax]